MISRERRAQWGTRKWTAFRQRQKVTFSRVCNLCNLCNLRTLLWVAGIIAALGLLYEFLPVVLLRYVLTHYF